MMALVGRDRDLTVVRELVGEEPAAVLLVGEAGVGKTALTRAATAQRPHRVGGALGTLRWLPYLALRRAFPDLPETAWTGDAVHATSRVLERLGSDLLVVEDAHWADPSTLDCLDALVGQASLLVTVRRGDAAATGTARRLEKQGATRVDLEPLTVHDTRDLVRRVRPDITASEAEAVVARSGGNPLLVEELAQGEERSESLRLAVLGRCRLLPDTSLEGLALLALAGQPLRAEDVPEVDGLVDAGLVLVDADGTTQIRHALIAEHVAGLLSEERRVRCHRRLARLLAHPGSVARHLLAVGDRAGAREAAMQAVAEAATPGERWRHLVTAAEADDGADASLLRARAAEAACTGGEPEEAGRLLEGISVSGPHAVEIALARATHAFQSGEWDRYLVEVESAARAAAPGTCQEAMVRARQATAALIVENRPEPALRLAGDAIALAEQAGISAACARATHAAAMAALGLEGWIEEFDAAIASARAEGDAYREVNARHNLVFALTSAGRLEDAWARAGEQLDRCRELGLAKRSHSAEVSRVVVAAYCGDHTWALDASEAMLGEALSPTDRCDVHVLRSVLLAQLGEVEPALAELEPVEGRRSHAGDVHGARLLALALAGQSARALDEWPVFCEALGHDAAEADTARAVAWAAWEAGVEIPVLGDLPDDGLMAGAATEVEGFRALAAGRPSEAAVLFDTARDRHGPRRWDALWCEWARGESLRRAGDDRAVEVLHRVVEQAGATGYAPIVTRARHSLREAGEHGAGRSPQQGADGPDPLTGRERQVVDLVVRGLTDREIAARLGVAHRTVQTQVASARRKLGAESRAHLVALQTEEP